MSTSSKPKHSFLLTVYERDCEVLLATLRSLWRSLGEDDQVVIVNDGSKQDYEWAKAGYANRFANFKWIDIPEYAAYRIGGGYNNPAHAFNVALENADADNVVIMSSDVIATPNAVKRCKSMPLAEMVWTPEVRDIESGMVYCGSSRLFPMPWMLACSRKHAMECGGWDEKYLDGMCWEDNDFVGRLMLTVGRFIGDWSVTVYHQSHNQPAYNVDDPKVLRANQVNKEYTRQKWAGLPFTSADDACFDIMRKMYETGDVVHECVAPEGTLEKLIAKTRSPFAGVKS